MQNNKNNNNNSWQQQLQKLDAVPGESFDAAAAWERLQQRKVKALPQRKPWYRLAAACILLLLAGGSVWMYSNTRAPAALLQGSFVADGIIAPPAQLTTANSIVVTSNNAAVTRPPVKAAGLKKSVAPVLATTSASAAERLPQINVQPSMPDTIPAIAAAPAKKKMKIARLNELEAPPVNSLLSQEEGRPFFPVRFNSRETFTSNNASRGSNIISIKLSSKN